MKVANNLISYNDLKKWIIDPGFCTLCGACVAACPVNALKIERSNLHHIHDCSEYMEFCPICYDICPHTEALLLESLSFVIDAPNMRESLGYYRRVLLAQAVDPKIRKLSHGGGVVTSILKNSIENKFIDGAVVSRVEKNVPLRLQPSVNLVPDDMFSAVDASYSPSTVVQAFGTAVQEYGKTKIAFVGTPCQILALRKMESWEHKLTDSLKVVIGLMCLWSFSLKHLFEYIEKAYKIKSSDIKKISLDRGYILHMSEGTVIRIPITELKNHILGSCLTCTDYTSQLADISVGGTYPLEGWSTVIIRTDTGEEVFEDAVKSGVIRIKKIEDEPEVFIHLVDMASKKRRMASEEIEKKKVAGIPVPPARLRLLKLLPKELRLLSSLSVGGTMTKKVITIFPDTTIEDLLSIMMKQHHMGYPILNKNEQLVGIATFEDVMNTPPEDRSRVKVGEIKQKKLITVYPDDTMLTAYEKMAAHEVGRVLVIDRENPKKLLGIITRTDIMQALMWPMRRI